MTQQEYNDIIEILVNQNHWQARPNMLAHMKTVKIDPEIPEQQEVPVLQENPAESNFEPQGVYLSGNHKPPYPEYNGPPTI